MNKHTVSQQQCFYSIHYTPLPLYFEKSVLIVGELVEKMYFSDFIAKNHVCWHPAQATTRRNTQKIWNKPKWHENLAEVVRECVKEDGIFTFW
jgi:hypothetical protein